MSQISAATTSNHLLSLCIGLVFILLMVNLVNNLLNSSKETLPIEEWKKFVDGERSVLLEIKFKEDDLPPIRIMIQAGNETHERLTFWAAEQAGVCGNTLELCTSDKGFIVALPRDSFTVSHLLVKALKLEHEIIPKYLDSDDYEGIVRWQEQVTHWDNAIAIKREISRLESKVVTLNEVRQMCAQVNSWITQLENAIAYVKDYQKDEPELADQTPELNILEETAQDNYRMSLEYRSHCRSL